MPEVIIEIIALFLPFWTEWVIIFPLPRFGSEYLHFLQKMRCLCWMKWTIETPQNLPYFWNSKTYVLVFFVFHDYVLCFSPNQLSRYLKKTKWIVFIFQKIWQIFKHLYARKSHFIKHKPLTSGEWRNKWTWY